MPTRHTEESFWARVQKTSTCWLFMGYRIPKGYGRMRFHGRVTQPHTVAWELANGKPVPEGLQIDHLCRVKHCCNPAHLEVVTAAENNRRSMPFRKKQTTCKYGHPWADPNLYYVKIPNRIKKVCKICSGRNTKLMGRKRSMRKGTARPHKWID
jgi:hypothetical protein